MTVRVLGPSDATLYRDVRLYSLQTNPEAYLSTYDMEANKPFVEFEERLKPSAIKFTLGAFCENGNLIGIATFVRETRVKITHKGNVYGMYVHPNFRGQGVGRALLQELITKAKACEGLEHINLSVVSNNTPAKRLYESMGFQIYGTERNAFKSEGQYFDEDFMVLVV